LKLNKTRVWMQTVLLRKKMASLQLQTLWQKYAEFSPQHFQQLIVVNVTMKRNNPNISLPVSWGRFCDFMQDYFQDIMAQELQKDSGEVGVASLTLLRYYLKFYYQMAILTDKADAASHIAEGTNQVTCSSLVRILSRWMATLLSFSANNNGKSLPSTMIIVLACLLRVAYRLQSIKLIEPLLTRIDQTFGAASPSDFLKVATMAAPVDCLIYLYFRGKIYLNDPPFWPLALEAFEIAILILRRSKTGIQQPPFIEKRVFVYLTVLRYLLNKSPPTLEALQWYGLLVLQPFFLTRTAWSPPLLLLHFDALYFTCLVEAKFRFILTLLKKWRKIEADAFTYRISLPQLYDIMCVIFGNNIGNSFVGSVEELEALLANMIHTSHIKGYLSHEKGTLVLSKKNPFPNPS
jgi:hypothetical protein